MQRNGIAASTFIKHKKAKLARHHKDFANNKLVSSFSSDIPNQKWVSDTTFIQTKQGWLYLATVIDLYSRKMVGWSMANSNNTMLVRDVLIMAINNKPRQQKVLLHSDQGATYRADDHLALFNKNNIEQSMSAKGDCFDNEVVESFLPP